MIAHIPGFNDYVREHGKVIGHCFACGYDGPMDSGMTGYECARCKSMKLELQLKEGDGYRQFEEQYESASAR